jgi:Tfp pilus assembly protein PilV
MKFTQKKLKGLSLLEVMVSMGIFSMMMVAVAGIFSSSIQSSRANRNIQHDLENAQFVMNDIAKQLRTSTIIDPLGNPIAGSSIRFYDYSQGKCISYTPASVGGNTVIQYAWATTTRVGCTTVAPLSSPMTLTTGDVIPTFRVVSSSLDTVTPANSRVGKVTMVFVVKEKATSTRSAQVQTTVSLRDYVESGVVQAN